MFHLRRPSNHTFKLFCQSMKKEDPISSSFFPRSLLSFHPQAAKSISSSPPILSLVSGSPSSSSSFSFLSPSLPSLRHTQTLSSLDKTTNRIIELKELPHRCEWDLDSEGTWKWKEESKPQTILIVKREKDLKSEKVLGEMCEWLKKEWPDVRVLVDPQTFSDLGAGFDLDTFHSPPIDENGLESGDLCEIARQLSEKIDLVISLGGDGTLLRACSMFRAEVPPVIAFHMGTVGFMTNARAENFKEEISRVMAGNFICSSRQRLKCRLVRNDKPIHLFRCLNDVAFHKPFLSLALIVFYPVFFVPGTRRSIMCTLDLTINGRPVTTLQGDGLVISTASGSTAYSLSCGGPVMHPECTGLVVTPIAPRSLSFRPILVPWDTEIVVSESVDNRSGVVMMSFDGRHSVPLQKGDHLFVETTRHSANLVCIENSMTDWLRALQGRLHWNFQ